MNVFQKGEDLLAVVELPGVEKNEIKVEAKENTIRIFGKKAIKYDDGVSVHRRERLFGEFDRTWSVPVAIEADGIIADFKTACFHSIFREPRALNRAIYRLGEHLPAHSHWRFSCPQHKTFKCRKNGN